MNNAPSHQYDIIIAGGGLVGLTTALLLAPHAFSIMVIDKKFVKKPPPLPSLRVSAINLASHRLIERLGIWQALAPEKKTPYQRMHIWEGKTGLDFTAEEANVPALGHIVENDVMQALLYQQLTAHSNVVLQETLITDVQKTTAGYQLMLADSPYFCSLLISADGADSQIRRLLKMPVHEKPYHQRALVCNVNIQKPHNNTASQVFLPTGPLAFLPLADAHSASLVWTLPDEIARERQVLEAAQFETLLMQATDGAFGSIHLTSERLSFDLWQRHIEHYVAAHLAFIGDAAHVIHPLAGLGVNLGLEDASVLARIIIDAKARQRPWFSLGTLKAYELQCKQRNQKFQDFCRLINALFASSSTTLTLLRQGGLFLFNKSNWLKRQAILQALGNDD